MDTSNRMRFKMVKKKIQTFLLISAVCGFKTNKIITNKMIRLAMTITKGQLSKMTIQQMYPTVNVNGYKMKTPNNLVSIQLFLVQQACEQMNLPDFKDLKSEMNRAKQ